jgi:hypothetical protein
LISLWTQFADDSFGLTGADIARLVRLARRVARRHRRNVTIEDVMASLLGGIALLEKFRCALAIHELFVRHDSAPGSQRGEEHAEARHVGARAG